ncbi:MAG TPA: PHP domain-containing protein [Jiangellales bacterium]|nr:PHP domain-containing protein [Jiangellales bacterium]
MRIDLHTHSRLSDGTDTPAELVRAALRARLDVVALTDHDTYAGWDQAFAAAAGTGLTVVPGVEISTVLHGVGVHLLGYLVDPSYGPLAAELALVRGDRRDRLDTITRRLREAGMELGVEEVLAQADAEATVGRPHVADAMVARGYVADRSEAFAAWLGEGRPAYAPKYAPGTVEAIRLVRAAGGAVVLAHPWGRSSRRVLAAEGIAALATAGLDGIEVDHEDHSGSDRAALRAIAAGLGLVVTGSSDHHGDGKVDHPLGVNTTAPEEYEDLLARAAGAARAAGRTAARPPG